jgi:hypothetical protein
VAEHETGGGSEVDESKLSSATWTLWMLRTPGEAPHYFGTGVLYVRTTYHDRRRRLYGTQASGLVQQKKITIREVVDCLAGEEQGERKYEISLAAFSAIENGEIFPREPTRFIRALGQCLDLSLRGQAELEQRLAFDLVYARFGEKAYELFKPEFGITVQD